MVRNWIVGVALGAMAASSAQAQVIADGGFEGAGVSAGSATSVPIGSASIPAWTVINHDGTTQTTTNNRDIAVLGNGAFGLTTPFGTDFLDLTGYNDSPAYAGVAQTIATTVGQAYTLTFWLGVSVTDGRYAGPASVLAYFGGQSVTVFNDGLVTAAAPNMRWSQQSATFTANAASTLVGIVGDTAAGGQFIGLDNVSLASAAPGPVPEPASWVLMLAGFGATGWAMRRRAKAQGSTSLA